MKSRQPNIYLWLAIGVVGIISTIVTQRAWAEVKVENNTQKASVLQQGSGERKIRQLSELEIPLTNAQHLLVQSPTPTNPASQENIIPITSVKANPTDKGVEVILETPVVTQLQVTNRSAGNNFIVDVSGGQLRLADGNAFTFRSEKPVAGITRIIVTNIDANTVRVTVVGVAAMPTVELFDDDAGLVFAVATTATAMQPPQTPQTQEKPASETPSTQGDEPIELLVTGEQDGYRVPNASVGTRTDTKVRDIPQSIQIVPQQVLRDQNVTRLNEALKNVPGITPERGSSSDSSPFVVRGFRVTGGSGNQFLRNGLRDGNGDADTQLAPDIERIEVLLGPASVLYGTGSPGGTINIVTKQPLHDPFYAVDATIGNYDFYQGAIDLSGPLNDSKNLLYRLNAGYLNRNSFVDFFKQEQFTVAPVISWDISERTRITLEGGYTDTNQVFDYGLPAFGTVLPNPNGKIPRSAFSGGPDGIKYIRRNRLGYRLEHQFSDNWSLQQAFQWKRYRATGDRERAYFAFEADNRTLIGNIFEEDIRVDFYDLNLNLTGRFSTGSIAHQLVFGADLGRFDRREDASDIPAPSLDIFNPVYELPPGAGPGNFYSFGNLTDTLGIYLQDQVTLANNLKLLLGGRFDLFEQTDEDFLADTESSQSGDAFSPRVGIVYQPIEPLSLYASYSRSFTPVTGTSFEGDQFQPERGIQYEVGVKADLNDRLSATLALYDLTRSGVLTPDTRPGVPPNRFSIQTGEQRTRGVELSIAGEILPGWNIIAGYAYTNAEISEDNSLPVGNRLANVSENTINFWTTYEVQRGPMKGFGAGVGLFFVGERQGDLNNSFQLPSYLRTDAAIFYKRDRLRVGLNFRNLFDVEYIEAAQYDFGVFYGEPLTVQATLRWEF